MRTIKAKKSVNKKRIHVSSGAVVIKEGRGIPRILVMYRRTTKSWHLPKGTRKKGETLKETALREVEEETGIQIELGEYLGKLHSVIMRGEDTIPKETHYFLAKPVGGKRGNHDSEHDAMYFLPFPKALRRLHDFSLYEKEGKIVKRAEHRFAH